MTATITSAATLAKRDGYVWGYVGGDSDSPVSCPGSLTPTIPTDAPNSIFCCDQASCVDAWRTCIDYLGTGCAEPDVCSMVYTSYLQCNAETPSCLSYVRVTNGAFASEGLTSYACAMTGGEVKVLVTPTSGDSASAPTGNSNNGGNSAGDGSSSGDNSSGSGGSGVSSSSGSGQDDNHSISAGAIVGIAIGAIIVILLVIGLIFWIRKCSKDRKRRNQKLGDPSRYADTEYEYRMRDFNVGPGMR